MDARSWILALGLVAFAAMPTAGAKTSPPVGGDLSPARWIERANQALLPTDSMVARVQLHTRDEYGGESLDVLDMVRVSSSERGGSRTLLEVEAPEEGVGTAYEVRSRADGTLERWVWLAELRRLRRIEGVRRTDHFLGSEFTYEDLGLALPVEREKGTVRWVGEGAERRVEIESPPYHYYGRVVTRIDPRTHLPTRVLFYDRAGQLFREQEFGGVRRIDGIPFPTVVSVRDRLTGTVSVLRFENVRFGEEVPEIRFTDSVIRRRLAASKDVVPDDLAAGD